MSLRLDEVFFYTEVVDDEVLALRGIFAHEEGEEFVGAVEVMELDRIEADVRADEVLEFARRDFAQTLEAGDFVAGAEVADSGLFLLLGITVLGYLFVADAEE